MARRESGGRQGTPAGGPGDAGGRGFGANQHRGRYFIWVNMWKHNYVGGKIKLYLRSIAGHFVPKQDWALECPSGLFS